MNQRDATDLESSDLLENENSSDAHGVNGNPCCASARADVVSDRRSTPLLTLRAYIVGAAAALGAIGFYLALLTVTSDWVNAKMQFTDYRWWLVTLAAGLGVQMTLYTGLRQRLAGHATRSANSSVAASGGMSAASMAVCCSHYLASFLPLIGLPFLSAAVAGLERYQVQFLMAGVLFNVIGIVVMARQLKIHQVHACVLPG